MPRHPVPLPLDTSPLLFQIYEKQHQHFWRMTKSYFPKQLAHAVAKEYNYVHSAPEDKISAETVLHYFNPHQWTGTDKPGEIGAAMGEALVRTAQKLTAQHTEMIERKDAPISHIAGRFSPPVYGY